MPTSIQTRGFWFVGLKAIVLLAAGEGGVWHGRLAGGGLLPWLGRASCVISSLARRGATAANRKRGSVVCATQRSALGVLTRHVCRLQVEENHGRGGKYANATHFQRTHGELLLPKGWETFVIHN